MVELHSRFYTFTIKCIFISRIHHQKPNFHNSVKTRKKIKQKQLTWWLKSPFPAFGPLSPPANIYSFLFFFLHVRLCPHEHLFTRVCTCAHTHTHVRHMPIKTHVHTHDRVESYESSTWFYLAETMQLHITSNILISFIFLKLSWFPISSVG